MEVDFIMGSLRFNYRSDAIGGYIDITVVYPTDNFCYYDMAEGVRFHKIPGMQQKERYVPGMKFQTVYLLHGGSDNDSLTYRYTNAELFAQRNNVMLVTPNIMNSFGADTDYGVCYGIFLTEELPLVMQTLFASSPEREDNFIMGYAMGGNAALGTAIKRPDLFHTCIDISGGIGYTVNPKTLQEELDGDHFRNHFPLYNASFGEGKDLPGSRHDMQKTARQHIENGDVLTKMILIAGSEEGFIRERVEADADTLLSMGWPVEYLCAQGYGHDFRMWNDYIEKALDHLIPLKRRPLFPENNEAKDVSR